MRTSSLAARISLIFAEYYNAVRFKDERGRTCQERWGFVPRLEVLTFCRGFVKISIKFENVK